MPRFLLVAALCSGLLLPSPRLCQAQARGAAGEAAPHEPSGYKAAIDSAVAEFEHGNYEESREHFAQAHALYPNARTLRGLGMVEFELRNYVDAVSYLEASVTSDVRALPGALRDETQALLQRARAYVGSVALHLKPTDATVSVDGFPLAGEHQAKLRLAVGDHVLEFHAPGHLSERRAVKLRGEQELSLEVNLALASVATAAATQTHAAGDRETGAPPVPVYKRWWLWTSVGLVVAGGVVAAVLLTRDTERIEQPRTTANTPPDATIYPWRSH